MLLRTTTGAAPKPVSWRPVDIRWDLEPGALDRELDSIADYVERLTQGVDRVQPSLPDFSTAAVVAFWPLETIDANIADESEHALEISKCLDAMSMSELGPSVPENLRNQYVRRRVPVEQLSPGGIYRGTVPSFSDNIWAIRS